MSDENLNELLAKRAPKKRSKFTTALIGILILLVGVFIGIPLGKGAGSSSTVLPVLTNQAAPAIGSSAGRPTAGMVKHVAGDILILQSASGADVAVRITDTTKITTPEEITVNELEIGSKVLVLGEQGDDGVITAQLVSEGAGLGTTMGG